MRVPVPRHRAFPLLLSGSAVAALGNWLLIVAIPVYVFQLTGSATATGLAIAVEALPGLLVGPWAGVLLDRVSLTRALCLAQLVCAAAVALIFLVDDAGDVWLLYLAVLAENTAATVQRPAVRALTPAVVGTGQRELAAANALELTVGSVLRLGAPPLGALLLAGPGMGAVLAIDVAGYLASAGLFALLGRRITPSEPTAPTGGGLRAGLAAVAADRALRGPLAANTLFLTANAGLTALLVPLLVTRLQAPGHALGYVISGLGAGFLCGAALAGPALSRFGTLRVLAAARVGTGGAFFALANAPGLPAAVLAACLVGVPGSMLLTAVQTHLQHTVPAGLLGRVAALFLAADSLAAIVGGLAAPTLAAALGIGAALNALSALALVPATLALVRGRSGRSAACPQ
ncbi:MFS transporter [Streptomyces sp. 8K308]|uniref:MFS transporter n=1 Tax=Streptomyces sp. 8K308 TaxID=2530388 RepID=UPI0014045576|nr:MFS transporter [Streptomyces sp. 8K308]